MDEYKFLPHQSGAVHEAGHAVISWTLGRRLIRVCIVRDAEGDGYTDHVPDATTDQDLIAEVAIALAGDRAAELWELATGAGNDRCRALAMLLQKFPQSESQPIVNDVQRC